MPRDFDADAKNLLAVVTLLSFVTLIPVPSALHFARDIFAFIYLTFAPGYILTRLLRINELGSIETILFSIGLSVAFLMLLGLSINFLYPLIGISGPFSSIPLLITVVSVTEILALLYLLVSSERAARTVSKTDRTVMSFDRRKTGLIVLLFTSLPILSVIGTAMVNTRGDNSILLVMLFLVAISFVVGALYSKRNENWFYAFALITVALALLLHQSLITAYIYGGDAHMEYHVFKITQTASRWNQDVGSRDLGYNWLNAMLSITILPTIYSNILDVDGTLFFKLIVPIIFAFISLGLLQIYRKDFGSRIAFLSVLFFMANSVFFTETLGNARQALAEFFYVLAFLVLLDKRFSGRNKQVLFIIFGTALIFSHYSMSYMFLFLAVGIMVLGYLLKKENRTVTPKVVITFSTLMFLWYIYTSNSGPFRGLMATWNWISGSFFNQFLVVGSRGEVVLQGVGLAGISTFWHIIGRALFYVTEGAIVIGFLVLLLTRRTSGVSKEYLSISLMNVVVLGACVIVPSFANTLNMTRFYHIMLIFLAPLFVVGILGILRFVRRKLRFEIGIAIVILILVPFFLFQTGVVYEIAGETNYSVPLSKENMGFVPYVTMSMVDGFDVAGAQWALRKVNYSNAVIYSDLVSTRALNSYGMVYSDTIQKLSNVTTVELGGIVFLGWVNVVQGKIFYSSTMDYNTSEISHVLDPLDKIYSSSGCEIYKRP